MELEFICSDADSGGVVEKVRVLAEALRAAWDVPTIAGAVDAAHVRGAQSETISQILAGELSHQGFTSEKKGLFAEYDVPGLRPDWYLPLENGDGVIAEVERGGVLTNNRDLLDFYKCHICRQASHLFLIAPIRVHGRGSTSVVKRMRALFGAGVGTNVRSVAVFGYGTRLTARPALAE